MRDWFWFMGPAYVVVVPALGGLIVGLLVYFFAREAKGHGVPEVMEAVALRGGRIRPRVAELDLAFRETHHHGFPVLDANEELFGVVTIQDLERAKERGSINELLVRDIATRRALVAYPDEPVWAALKRLGTRDVGRLPVVDRQNPKLLVGAIRRHDIVRAYQVGIGRKLDMQTRTDQLRLGKLTGTELVDVEVLPDSPVVHRAVKELKLPEDCVLISVLRDNRVIIPHGDTRLMPGDRLTALVGLGCMPEFQRIVRDATDRDRPA